MVDTWSKTTDDHSLVVRVDGVTLSATDCTIPGGAVQRGDRSTVMLSHSPVVER